MYDRYREACFSQKIFANGLNMGLPLQREQRSFIKYLLVEKCKPCEIYRRMYDLYREAYFSQRNLHKWVKHRFATTILIQKDSPWSGKTLTLQQKKKLWVQQSVKKVMLTIIWDIKRPITFDLLEKIRTANSASFCQPLRQNSPYLLNDPSLYIFVILL